MAASGASTLAGAAERPNILVLMSDQHSSHALGCYGDPIVRTPHLDALAASGTVFEHAYCQAPLCVPSRMSFLTGQQPSEIRVWSNADFLPSDIPTFAHTLGAAGYETLLIGRMHFNGADQWHGFGKRLVGSLTPMYPHIKIPITPELLLGAQGSSLDGLRVAGYGKTAYQAYDSDVTRSTIDFLHAKSKQPGKPFCAVAGFVLPHPPYVCRKEDWDYYLERVTLPSIPPGYFETLHPAMKSWRKARGVEQPTPDDVRRARAGYYGLVTQFDRQVGPILGALRESGLDKNTVVVYTTDHGEMAGELGMWWKSSFYEGAVSVPLIVSWPGKLPAGRRVREIVSMVDIGPTIAELASTEPMPAATGRIFAPLLRGEKREWPNLAFSEFPPSAGTPAIRMVRSGRWKLIHYDGMRPQLFDLEKDPHELHDLAENAEFLSIRKPLQAKATEGWSAEEIKREQRKRARFSSLQTKWAQQVRPDTPQQWKAPEGANDYTVVR